MSIFLRHFKSKICYKINLDIRKNIPVGGGLAGGSSNAASIIRFLVKLFDIDISANREKIIEMALSIGSDVPFFLMLKPCYAEGRGEKMVILREFVIDYDILIVNANLHVSTKWAFEKLDLSPDESKESLLSNIKVFKLDEINLFTNDFEEIVFEKYTLLGEIKSMLLESGAVYASMSGSGATMYGFFPKDKREALRKCRGYYNAKNYFTFISD